MAPVCRTRCHARRTCRLARSFSLAPPFYWCSPSLRSPHAAPPSASAAITYTTAPCRPGPWRYAGWTRSRSSCAPGREPRYRASISIDCCAGCATCTAPRRNHRTVDHIMQGAPGRQGSGCRGKEKGIELKAECRVGSSEGMGSTRPDALPHGLFADEPCGVEQPHTKCFVGDARDGHIPKHSPSTPQCCIACERAKEQGPSESAEMWVLQAAEREVKAGGSAPIPRASRTRIA